MKNKKKLIAGVVIAAAVAATAVFCVAVGVPMVRFVSDPAAFRQWVDSHGLFGRAAYVFMTALQIVVAVLPGEPFEIAGGYAFGAVEGTLLCLLAEGLGSVAVLLLVRKYGMKLAEIFFDAEKLEKLSFLHSSPAKIYLFSIIFIIPGTPKDLLCFFAGLTDINMAILIPLCFVGRLPSIVTSTLTGSALGEQSYITAAVVFAVTLVVSLAGILVYNIICRRNGGKQGRMK